MAVITACAVNLKPTKAADDTATPSPVILDGAPAEYTGQPQKIVTDLPAGVRYAISTEYIDPTTIDAGKIVPTGYTALDYLEGTGTQWIDTGWATTSGMVVRYAAEWTSDSTIQSDCPVGFAEYTDRVHSNSYGLLRPSTKPLMWEFGFGRSVKNVVYSDKIDQKYGVQFSTVSGNGYLDVDGQRLISDNSTQNVTGHVYLYTSSLQYTATSEDIATCTANIYYVTIWDGSHKLVRDFVPVQKDNGDGTFTYGMYDLVEDKLYTNDGTGNFMAGEPVNTALNDLAKELVWLDNVDDEANQIKLEYDKTYYVYYYTANTDTTTNDGVLSVKEFTVACNNHVYGEWEVTTDPTCTATGIREHTCTICGHTDTAEIPATGHDYTKASFDKDTGITTLVCAVCNTKSDITYPCTDKEHGHNFVDTPVAAECEAVGYTTHRCTNCGYHYNDSYTPATGHSYGAWVTVEPATTDAAGVQKRTCHCGAEQTRSIAPLAGTTSNNKDNSAPLLWGIIIGIIAVLAGCGGLAWLLLAVFKPRKNKPTDTPPTPKPTKTKRGKEPKVATA